MLVPEIALTPAVAGQFYARFGDQVAILHSAFSDSERAEQWRRSGRRRDRGGGTRSEYSPREKAGLIIIEKHDASYKQEETPRYNGRDVAIVRAQAAGAVWCWDPPHQPRERFNAASGNIRCWRCRAGSREADAARDCRRYAPGVSGNAPPRDLLAALAEAIRERLDNREQAMVLLNGADSRLSWLPVCGRGSSA